MKLFSIFTIAAAASLPVLFQACSSHASPNPNQEMVQLLAAADKASYNNNNSFYPEARLQYFDSLLRESHNETDSSFVQYAIARTLLELGDEEKAMQISEALVRRIPVYEQAHRRAVLKTIAIACLRLGERTNCIKSHTGESCVFPIAGKGIHADKAGSRRAISAYEELLREDPTDFESRWLLNIAYMTIGEYPAGVPASLVIPGLDADTAAGFKPFTDIAISTGLNTNNMAGGSIVDDFNNDGYLDLVTSSWGLRQNMHYCRNNSNGTFSDESALSGLQQFTGGLNLIQADYNNDGLKDIFVLRGAWKGRFGKEPNSLLKNNGDGTFTDVTKASGLLSFHPTQTATWADFNNDGWLDLFIGNETSEAADPNPCELYINNKNGTFAEQAAKAGCAIVAFVKGVTSGDYDKDGLTDIFVSTLDGRKALLKNMTKPGGTVQFTDVAGPAGLASNKTRTFPTWFWDYDNDGWLDILVSGYEFEQSLAWYAGQEGLGRDPGPSGHLILFRNKHDGTFEDVSKQAGLHRLVFAMGANFGDIDNDGYLDMYFGTGNPLYQSLVPNKMFRNKGGKQFEDVTTAARVGNLQKGHGVSFADLDNDGDQDVYVEMGGAYTGDAYQNSLYLNPGQNNNQWINICLEGTKTNRSAIGAKIKVVFKEKGVVREVYRDVNSGGSFGSNPLMQHIGIGQAVAVERIEVSWPVSGAVQLFNNIEPGANVLIKEGDNVLKRRTVKKADFALAGDKLLGCTPATDHH
ncbi:CRTAC1 family protein [Paraflavitalea sp. CAU 1676]|uniref:CRTAC1 family protein n=1 Tax=Paraflavitalea sp. CAU 1676 TaxID=3032598 RepID=UPI0023DB0DC0|nr:CRTAC1 family protein [Paraflavitalea sp. CAU 1676]MDF2189115.1 CRTAC1 family protein [Paraflavitalea sp. CAU 1676]